MSFEFCVCGTILRFPESTQRLPNRLLPESPELALARIGPNQDSPESPESHLLPNQIPRAPRIPESDFENFDTFPESPNQKTSSLVPRSLRVAALAGRLACWLAGYGVAGWLTSWLWGCWLAGWLAGFGAIIQKLLDLEVAVNLRCALLC